MIPALQNNQRDVTHDYIRNTYNFSENCNTFLYHCFMTIAYFSGLIGK